jgi:hypothetical protein
MSSSAVSAWRAWCDVARRSRFSPTGGASRNLLSTLLRNFPFGSLRPFSQF